jgi:hypothetical protein
MMPGGCDVSEKTRIGPFPGREPPAGAARATPPSAREGMSTARPRTPAARPTGRAPAAPAAPAAERCRRKFLRVFPRGFQDPKYIHWERGYKWTAHEQWTEQLGRDAFRALLDEGAYAEVAARAVRIESRTNLLFSFEKMALRDAVRVPEGARAFAGGLFDFLHAEGDPAAKFERWVEVVESLPRRQTRVLTWPLVTVFGFLAQPDVHIFLKPMVTRKAAREYGADFPYRSRPNGETYAALLAFAEAVRGDLRDLAPRDLIDVQSFLWVLGSSEYDD